jgi:hypothetical protein
LKKGLASPILRYSYFAHSKKVEDGVRGAMEQRTHLSGPIKPSFCRTARLRLAEVNHGAIFGMKNWFVESKFSFLPPW